MAEKLREWTPEEDDLLLETICKATHEGAMLGSLDSLARLFGRVARGAGVPAGDVCRIRAWKLATRHDEYVPGPTCNRTYRTAEKATCGELWLAKQAATSRSEEAKTRRTAPPDAEYLATLCWRPPSWAKMVLEELDPKRRFKGFGL